MSYFQNRDGVTHAEQVALSAIADAVGTPVYVYSAAAFRDAARGYRQALAAIPRKHLAFAVKANPNLAVLDLLAAEGYGADIVSGGELAQALAAGMPAADILFSGVGKTDAELVAALDRGVGQFNLELEEEGRVLGALAVARGQVAPAVLRVNPAVDADTHPKITTGTSASKFGVPIADAPAIYARLAKVDGLRLRGVAVHIGSQITDLSRLEAAYVRIGRLVAELRHDGHPITHVDLGGGLGIAYRPEDTPASPADYGAMVARVTRGWDVTLQFEPGRALAGAAGVLLTRVLWVKPGNGHLHVVVDAAMNDLARPALYDAWHLFTAVVPTGGQMIADVVGPVCESGDTFATMRSIDCVRRGDLAVFHTAGAYGASMASTYNGRPLVPEILVDGAGFAVVADRGSAEAMLARQHFPAGRGPVGGLSRAA